MPEAQAHSDFSTVQTNVKIRRLTSTSTESPPVFDSITFPVMKHVFFESNVNLNVEETVYTITRKAKFPYYPLFSQVGKDFFRMLVYPSL